MYINPWENPTNEINLLKGKNLFWIDNDNNFSIETPNLTLEGKQGQEIELKIIPGVDIDETNYKSVLKTLL